MNRLAALIDVAPDPVGIGVVAIVVLLVIGIVVFLALAMLIIFLWYRKRSARHLEMARSEADEPAH